MPKSQLAKERKGTQCRSDSSLLVPHLPLHSSPYFLSMRNSEPKLFCYRCRKKKDTMHHSCSLPGRTCWTTERFNCEGLFIEVFPQPLLHLPLLSSPPVPCSKINPYLVQIKITLHIVAPHKYILHSAQLVFPGSRALIPKGPIPGCGILT